MSDVGLILEKLNFEKIIKPQISLMWKVIYNKYINNNDTPLRNSFKFDNKHVYFPEDSGIPDIDNILGHLIISVEYDFNKAKKLFIKEPYVCFCIDSNYAYFVIDKEILFDKFLDKSVYGNDMEVVELQFPAVYNYLISRGGYNKDSKNTTVNLGDVIKMGYYEDGKELFDKAYKIIKNGLSKRKPVWPHGIKWIDRNLFPMFIWDTDEGFVYTCGGLTAHSNLDRRSLNSNGTTKISYDHFIQGDKVVRDIITIGFPYLPNNDDWYYL